MLSIPFRTVRYNFFSWISSRRSFHLSVAPSMERVAPRPLSRPGLALGGDEPPVPPHKLQPPPSGHKIDHVDLLLDRLFAKKDKFSKLSPESTAPQPLSAASSSETASTVSDASLENSSLVSSNFGKQVNRFQAEKNTLVELLGQQQQKDIARMDQFRRSTGTKLTQFSDEMKLVRDEIGKLQETVKKLAADNQTLQDANRALRSSAWYGILGSSITTLSILGLLAAAISQMSGVPLGTLFQSIGHSARAYANASTSAPAAAFPPQSVSQAARYLFLAVLDYFRNLAGPRP